MLHRSLKQRTQAVGRDEILREFLAQALPPGDTNQVNFFATALEDAGARYDRYSANKHEWSNYAARRSRLNEIVDLARSLASNLSELDILSRDEIARRSDPKEIKVLLGSLKLLGNQISGLLKESQSNGTPRDLAEQLWIEEVADIYKNAFRQPVHANWTASAAFCS
jgi:hypothetical protein